MPDTQGGAEPGAEASVEKPAGDAPAAVAAAIDVGASCTLQDVQALRQACLDALAGGGAPSIDASKVERVDTAGLQVLVAFAIDCMERSVHFSWVGRSPALARGIRLLGLDALLESPGLAASMSGGA